MSDRRREGWQPVIESTHHATPGRGYVLRLFVTGMTARSTRAIENIRAICEEHFAGAYELEVVNLYEQPARRLERRRIQRGDGETRAKWTDGQSQEPVKYSKEG